MAEDRPQHRPGPDWETVGTEREGRRGDAGFKLSHDLDVWDNFGSSRRTGEMRVAGAAIGRSWLMVTLRKPSLMACLANRLAR